MVISFGDGAANLVQGLHIHLQGQGATYHRFNLIYDRGTAFLPPQTERHVGPDTCERKRRGPSERPRRRGDQCGLPLRSKLGYSSAIVPRHLTPRKSDHTHPDRGSHSVDPRSRYLSGICYVAPSDEAALRKRIVRTWMSVSSTHPL
jgi:hypothetical protein